MRIVQRMTSGVAVLELHGNLDCGNGDEALKRVIDELRERGCTRVVVNLKDVPHIDTTCLGFLISTQIKFQHARGGLVLLQTPPHIRYILALVRLQGFLVTFETEAEAVAALSASGDALRAG